MKLIVFPMLCFPTVIDQVCASNPCMNGGSCQSSVEYNDEAFLPTVVYECSCPVGWGGDTCEG